MASEAQSTPDSRLPIDTSSRLSKGAKRRIREADPNGRRCLIENCPDRAIEYCHVVARSWSHHDDFMDSVEWFWNMRRKSLNLDTSRNVLFAGAALHSLFDDDRWALLPPQPIIDQYVSSLVELPGGIHRAKRESFPNIPDGIYDFRFIPLRRMEHFGVTRQTKVPPDADSFENHIYPFDSIPAVRCHIHPKFAILELGRKLDSADPDMLPDLMNRNASLVGIFWIYRAWTASIPKHAVEDASYIAADDSDSEDDEEKDPDYEERGSTRTAAHRVRTVKRKRSASNEQVSPSSSQRVRHVAGLSRETLVGHEHEVGRGGWTKESLSSWATDCVSSFLGLSAEVV